MDPNSTATNAVTSIQARHFSCQSSSNHRDLEAASSMGVSSAEIGGNQGLLSSWSSTNDYDREVALSMALDAVSMIAQVIHQSQSGSPNMVAIFAIVVSLFAFSGHKFFSRHVSVSAARSCSSLALFSSSLAIASVLAMPLRGTLKCLPYAVCFFPLLSLLSVLFPCNGNDPYGWFPLSTTKSLGETEEAAPPPPSADPQPPFWSSWDYLDCQAVLSIALNIAAMLVQAMYKSPGGENRVSIVAIVVSLCACLAYNYMSRTVSVSAARICSSVALFSAAFAIASLLVMPLHGILLKCIPCPVSVC